MPVQVSNRGNKKNTQFPSSFEKVKQALETVRTGEHLLKMEFQDFSFNRIDLFSRRFWLLEGRKKNEKDLEC